MNLDRIHHISFMVSDLEASRDFYGRILGLKEIPRPDFDFQGAWYQVGNLQLHLSLRRGPYTLVEAPGPRDEHVDFAVEDHVAFPVEDYEGTLKRLQEEGVPHVEKFNPVLSERRIFARDPDGNMLEFLELSSSNPPIRPL